MPATELHVFRCLSDNAGALIRDGATGAVAAVDVPDAGQVLAAAREKGWTVTDVLVTHEHADHVQGIAELKAATGATVTGPAEARAGAPVDRVVAEGDVVRLGGTDFEVWHTPGHAAGHLTYVSAGAGLALVGDVVFVMGCGRILGSGSAGQLWQALERIMALPDEVRLLTGHDYTLSNARFAAAMDPANAAVQARLAEAVALKAEDAFWATTTIGEEKATNPFFRAGQGALAAAVGLVGAPAAQVFAALREAKNTF